MKDSATLALVIFTLHISTLVVLIVSSAVTIGMEEGATLKANVASALPVSASGGIGMDLFLGYSVALLGLTGFETSANFIEESGPFETEIGKKGPVRKVSVFERTVDRMWWLVILVNPAIAVAALGVVDLPTIVASASTVLSVVGERAGGPRLRVLVAVDAISVLSGGVLTAYVGVVGLIKQLASDRCFPAFLLSTNRFGTHHFIILSFGSLCVALYLVTGGDVIVVSGVFAVAFLMVLLSFAVANMKLKYCRPRLPRGSKSGWPTTIIGFSCMFIGLVGNIYFNVELLFYFLIFLALYLGVITVPFWQCCIKCCVLSLKPGYHV